MNQEFLIFPKIDPVAFSIGPFPLHWYGVTYLLGLVFAYWLGMKRAKSSNGVWTVAQVDQLLFNGFFGVVLGGRIGDVMFYRFDNFLQDPLYLLRIWEGGMSFHGGLIGVIITMIWTSYRQQRSFWQTADFVSPLIPFGLGMGRIGNFINSELWGRVTDVPWAMVEQYADGSFSPPRHPSQLYEAFLEGFVLFIILNIFIRKPRPTGSVAGLFLFSYGIFRFLVEYVREIDSIVNTTADLITRGQLFSLPMIIVGLTIMALAYKFKK